MSQRDGEPAGVVNIVDPSPLNWLYITYNTAEELIRVDHQGNMQPAAMRHFHWIGDRTRTWNSVTATSSRTTNLSPPNRSGAASMK